MIKVSVNGIAMAETRPRVHTFAIAGPLNNNNIIGSHNYPSHATKSHSKVTNSGAQMKRLW